MPSEITMPQLTDTMTEGTVVKWLAKEGDKVKAGGIIAEVETDKAVMEMEIADSGVLAAIVIGEGQKAAVGAVMGLIAKAGEDPQEVKKQAGGAKSAAGTATASAPPAKAVAAESKTPAPSAASSGGGVATLVGASRGEIRESADVGHGATRETPTAVPPMPGGNGNGHRVFASPLARRIAVDRGIDLGKVTGSGPGGRIVQRDVLTFTPAPAAPAAPESPAPLAAAPGATQVIVMTKMRSAIAAALQKSKQTIPHFYETVDIDIDELSKLRERINGQLEKEKVRLSIADFITKAVAATLVRHPALNARFNPEKNEITRFADVNLGLAVSIPDGLIVPVLRGANALGLREIRTRSADLIERARAQKLKQGEQGTGTFTISSLGTFGIREFSAIINPPEVAILAVGSAEKRAVVRKDQVVARTMLTVTLSADHRIIDGSAAAEFLRTLKGMLEEPGMMLV
jgi:pyruvate dehydrogenase E2 component (dihydrolipoamide acetyltransferase)